MWKVGDRVAFDMPGVTYTGVIEEFDGFAHVRLDDHHESEQRVVKLDPTCMGFRRYEDIVSLEK